jgi:hypothetical protein
MIKISSSSSPSTHACEYPQRQQHPIIGNVCAGGAKISPRPDDASERQKCHKKPSGGDDCRGERARSQSPSIKALSRSLLSSSHGA